MGQGGRDDHANEAARNQFNPELYCYNPAHVPPWQPFKRVTVATITWNRLDFTKRFIESVLRHSQLPYRLLIVDNASSDGSVEFLRSVSGSEGNVELIENRRNKGKTRALEQIRDAVEDGLVVYCDNDIEVLSNYWLVLVLKAFHAFRLARNSTDIALGLPLVNFDEYGFRYSHDRQVFDIPGNLNAEPRTSYASATKAEKDPVARLNEQVVIGWTEFLGGGVQAMPAAIFRQLRFEHCYPLYIGGEDAFVSAELRRLGIPMGYVENGPILRHNDWPYTEEKIALYEKLTKTRATTDVSYVKWKIRALLGRVR